MTNMNKKIALLLIFTILLNITAAAQNDPAEATVYANDATVSSGGFFADTGENAAIKWTNKIKKSIMSGFCSCVVYKNHIYTAADRKIYKIDRFTGKTVNTANLYGTIGYTYYMAQENGTLFVQLKNGIVQAFSADTLKSLWISETPVSGDYGQGLSPISCDNGHIYAGTVVMNKNYGTGSYYCLDTLDADPSNEYEVKPFVWQFAPSESGVSSIGFYGTGAAFCGENIIFGSEDGTVYLADKASGRIKDSLQTGANMRSTVSIDGKNAYFTTKDGRLWRAEVTENGFGNAVSTAFCADSSCEPVMIGGRVYVGGSDGGYTNGSFCVFDAFSLERLAKFDVLGNVQARPLVFASEGAVYAYFTCNYTPGKAMRLKDSKNGFELTEFFTPSEEYGQYCINRINIDRDGVLYYQNDSGWIIAFSPDKTPDDPAETISEITTEMISETASETTSQTASQTASETASETASQTPSHSSSHSGGGGGSYAAEYINVSFEIIGDTPHGADAHTASTVWLKNNTYKIKKGSSAEDLVLDALEKNDFKYVIHQNGYISEITSPDGVKLAEFDNGINSGWMYTKNGVFVQIAMRGCTLDDGDTLILLYSDDYTKTDMRSDSSNEIATETTTQSAQSAQTTAAAEYTEETTVFDNYFKDVETGVWYFYPVECLHASGIVNGRQNGLFCPDDSVTRAEFVTMLHRIFGGEGKNCPFEDVVKTQWYYEAITWAAENKTVYGIDQTHFAPSAPITRQDAAAILYRLTDGKPIYDKTDFSDDNDISAYAHTAAAYFAEKGIINGSNGRFEPKRTITRAETCSLLYEYIEKELLNK